MNTAIKAWTHCKDVTRDGITVRITVLAGYRPKYSVALGRVIPSREQGGAERFVPHLAVFSKSDLGQAEVAWDFDLIDAVFHEAINFVREECQRREDEIIEEKQAKELQDANRNKQATRHTGKTERDRSKHAGAK